MVEPGEALPINGAWGEASWVPTVRRSVLHLRDGAVVGLSGAILRAERFGEGHALRLGPEEWLLIDATIATPAITHSLVEVSARQIGLVVSGPCATELLAAGICLDLDLRAWPVGMASRTLFGKAEIVLWRQGETVWRLEIARSFAPYLARYLAQAVADLPNRD